MLARRSILLAMIASGSVLGCQPKQPATTDVVMRTTTRPADREPARQVEVFVQEPPGQRAGDGAGASAGAGVEATPVGHNCRVQFRRDALGMATPAPVPPTAVQAGAGRPVAMEGRVVDLSRDWVVLQSPEGKTFWIPQSAVLLIERLD